MTLNLGILLKLDKGNVASGAAEAAKSIDGIGDAAERTTAQANRMDAALTTAKTAATSGARATITAANAQTSALHNAADAALHHHREMGLAAGTAGQLTFQLNDVFVSLAAGQNPMMVAIQQGSQISQIYGGIGNTIRALLGVLTPMRVGVGGLAGAALLGAKAAMDHGDALRDEAIAVQGLGRNAGLTVGGLEAVARASAKGAGLSISASRGMAVEFARTGKIGETEIGGLIGISRDFATTIGSDVTTATKMLGGIFADPAKGADTLYRSLGLIDGGTARLVQRLADQNRVTEARIALLAGLKPRLVDSEKDLWFYERAWRAVGTAISDAYSAAGRTLGPKTGNDLLAALEERAKRLRTELQQTPKADPNNPYDPAKAFVVQNDASRRELEATEREIRALRDKAEAERDAAAEAKRRSEQDRAIDAGRTIAGSTTGAVDGRQSLIDDIAKLRANQAAVAERYGAETRETPAIEAKIEEATKGTANALAMKSRALSTWISEADRARQLADIDLALMAARDPIERANLERKRVLVQLAGQEVTETNATAAANLAYARSIGEVSAQVRGSITDLLADAAARRLVNDLVASGAISAADAARELQIEAQTRQLVALAAQKEGAEKERLLAQAGALRAAIVAQSEAEKRASAQQSLADGRDRLETLRTEIALVGQSEIEHDRVVASLRAEQEIRRRNLDTASAEAMQIRATAVAEADLTAEVARRRRALEQERGKQLDRIDLTVTATRDPTARASLEAERARLQARSQGLDETEAAAAAERAYARSIGEVSAQVRGSITDLLADAAARRLVNDLVASGAISAADAARELQIEAQTRQLVALAAQKEGAEKERLLAQAGALRAAIVAQSEAEKRASAQQSLADGRDRLETLRTEIALVGQSEAVRTRVLALLEAEQKIRKDGLQGTPEADRMRALAEATAAANTALERQKSAWGEIQSTGGSAIDTLVEGLRTRKDVSKQLAEDLEKEAYKLAIANPIKNALFNQSLPTAGDVGGMLGGLIGGAPKAGGLLPQSIATATITAATVIVNGAVGGLSSVASSLGLAGNDNVARIAGVPGLSDARRAFSAELADPTVRNRLFAMTEAEVGGQGPAAQQAFMESTFNRASARGLTLDQTLGDRRYFPAETFAAADRVMGAPRLDAKYGDLLAQVRGGSNLSNYATGNASGGVGFGGGPQTFAAGGERFGIEKPDMIWARELQQSSAQTSQSIAQMGTRSTSVTSEIAGLGSTTTQVGQSLTSSATGITQAGQTLSTSTTSLASGTQGAFSTLLGGLGSGIDALLTGLTGIIAKIAGAGGGGIFGGLFAGFFGGGGAAVATPTLGGLYDSGGFTGIGGRHEPAGIVHRGEYVFDADAVSRIGVGTLETMRAASKRGYASGGWVGGGAAMPTRAAARDTGVVQPVFQTIVQNHSSAEISTREEPDGRGGRRQVVVVEEMVGRALTRPGSVARSGLGRTFGARPVRTLR